MELLSSVASAATSRVSVTPCTTRLSASWRRGDLGFCAPGIGGILQRSAGKCRAQAVETATPVAERPLWLPGSTPPAYLDGTLRPRQLGLRLPKGLVCRAVNASYGGPESSSSPQVFPRVNVRDPFKRLGVPPDASTEEIREAKNYLSEQYHSHENSRESIEAAYEKIIMESYRARKASKINLKSNLKKKVDESPPWIRALLNMVDVPKKELIGQRAALFFLLGVWSVFNPAEGGPAFQVAVSLAACVYFINDRLKSLGRAFVLGLGSLAVGWIFGSVLIPVVPSMLIPRTWSLELTTALISYVSLWFSCTFLK